MCNDTMVRSVEYRGFTIEIHVDDNPVDPTKEWDMLGTMVCAHRRYDLGHVQIKSSMEVFEEILTPGQIESALAGESKEDWLYGGELHEEDNDRLWKAVEQYAITLPLYLYDHGGITIRTSSFSCPWDSGMVGIIYVLKDAVREEWEWKRITKSRKEKIESILRQEVETYNDYLTGSVYGYVVKEQEDDDREFQHDSCWGFYGWDHEASGLMIEARGAVDYQIESGEKREREYQERAQHELCQYADMLAEMAEAY